MTRRYPRSRSQRSRSSRSRRLLSRTNKPAWPVGLVSGILHPLTGTDHLIAIVAVGIWGAQLGGAPAIWMLPITFPVVMAFGGVLGVLRVHYQCRSR